MKIGDIVTDTEGKRWVIFEFSDCKEFLYVADFIHDGLTKYMNKLEVIEVDNRPHNVEWLFLKRRSRNLRGIGNIR